MSLASIASYPVITALPVVYHLSVTVHSTIYTDDDGRRICLLTVSNFDKSHSCVLVNLKTLKCSEVKFRTSLLSTSPSVPQPLDAGDIPTDAEPDGDVNYMDMYQDDDDDMD